jgi:hypothetical protein
MTEHTLARESDRRSEGAIAEALVGDRVDGIRGRRIAIFLGNRGVVIAGIVLVLLLGEYFRLFRLNDINQFMADQGRQSLVVHDLVVEGQWPLVGPFHTYGGHNYGPIYYYLQVPAFLLLRGDPRFGAVTQALLGGIMIVLLYFLTRQWGGSRMAGITASFLAAVNPLAVWMDRTLWNPNELPVFSVFGFWYAGMMLERPWWPCWPLLAVLAILTQLHQGGWPVAMAILAGIVVLFGLRRIVPESVSPPRPNPGGFRGTRLMLASIDAVLSIALIVGYVLLFVHSELPEPRTLGYPMKFLRGEDSIRGLAAVIGDSLGTIGKFVNQSLFPATIFSERFIKLFWILSIALLAIRLSKIRHTAKIMNPMLFLGLTGGAYLAAYSSLTSPVEDYTFSAALPLLLVVVSLIWIGGPGRGGTAESQKPSSNRRGRSLRPVIGFLPAVVLFWFGIQQAVFTQTIYLQGRWTWGTHFKTSRMLADWIIRDCGSEEFGLYVAEWPGSDRDYLRYLLVFRGRDCLNKERRRADKEVVGRITYLVIRPPDMDLKLEKLLPLVEQASINIARINDSAILRLQWPDTVEARRFLLPILRSGLLDVKPPGTRSGITP